jgi:RNA recognition motif-containing protein
MEMFRQYAVVVNVHLMRDWSTGMSRGIAFVEFQSVEHAAHTKSMTQQIRMGSTYLKVGFARPGYEKFFQQQVHFQCLTYTV